MVKNRNILNILESTCGLFFRQWFSYILNILSLFVECFFAIFILKYVSLKLYFHFWNYFFCLWNTLDLKQTFRWIFEIFKKLYRIWDSYKIQWKIWELRHCNVMQTKPVTTPSHSPHHNIMGESFHSSIKLGGVTTVHNSTTKLYYGHI